MSRVDRLPIAIPTGITVAVSADNVVSVKGPKGGLVRVMDKGMDIAVENNQVVVTKSSGQEKHRVFHGLTRALVDSAITEAEEGFEKSSELIGVGYKVRLQGKKLVANLRYSYPVEIEPTGGVTFEVPAATKVVVKGIDKEKAGTAVADIRSWREPEPYKGKGVKHDNEIIRCRKGKTGRKQ